MSEQKRVLWADDEIDLLRPHILFLKEKGYDVTAVTNGDDAVSMIRQEGYDAVLLDENMPGRGGLETLSAIQEIRPGTPVIMITKSEEEHIMDEAIGQQIRDYLIKPVNPSQIQLALKRILEGAGIRKSTLTRDYVKDLASISNALQGPLDSLEWMDVAERLATWDLGMETIQDPGLRQTHADQKREANAQFGRFVESNYASWLESADRPALSVDLFDRFVFPHIEAGERVAFILIDCMRLDQWLALRSVLKPIFDIQENRYLSILPTATPYSRNAIFSGLFPKEMADRYAEWWDEDPNAKGSRNRYEREFLETNLKRRGIRNLNWKYQKVFTQEESAALKRQATTFASMDFVALVFNFLDILAHGRAESEILLELAPTEEAFRKLLMTWFEHSNLFEIIRTMADQGTKVVITTDHGAVMVSRAALVNANREASANLRYKFGSNLRCDGKAAVHVKNPATFMLPDNAPTKHYLISKESYFFVYPNNFHRFERQFRDTFQHGGISLDEMVLPCCVLTPR